MSYLKKARGPIVASCHVPSVPTRRGDHQVKAEALLRDEVGEVVARAEATWKISITG